MFNFTQLISNNPLSLIWHLPGRMNAGIGNVLTKYMNPDILLVGAEILAFCILIVVLIIYFRLFYRKRNFLYINRLKKDLETLVAQIVMEELNGPIVISAKFLRKMNNRAARQFVIDELIRVKKSFSGLAGENIIALYLQLGLKAYSLKKMQNKNKWHIKARGIQELYMMDQMDVITVIYRNTNSNNELVRMEAQTGVIHLTGFPGLRFLDIISYPLTEWQQLKLLEQLRLNPVKEDLTEKIPHWLLSKNETVVVFALKLADEFQQFSVRSSVINCLVHPKKSVRSQALKTLIRLADENSATILLGYFNKEPFTNQVFILDALQNMATEKEAEFLLSLLNHANNTIKLKAAIVLASCTKNGLTILQKKAAEQPEPFERILRHIKIAQ
jgi:hypothetical protein